MSDKNLGLSSDVQVVFAGTDITKDIRKYLLSMSYIDNEDAAADDLQIKLEDKDGLWLEKWLDTAIHAAAGYSYSSGNFMVVSQPGVNVRSGAGKNFKKLGTLTYGTSVSVKTITGSWAEIEYDKKKAYVNANYIQQIGQGSAKSASSDGWHIGDEVIVSGRPQYSSYGEGTPGANVTNYTGKITYLNQKSGVPYPICVGYLGWFSEKQVTKKGQSKSLKTSEGASSKGLLISANILRKNRCGDGKDDLLECGQFELDSVTAEGPPSTVTIKGTSLPYSSTIRQTEKSKSWENYTLSGIVKEIANGNGLAYMFSSSKDPSYRRVEQYRQTDVEFLEKLCHDSGLSLKITNNILVVFEQSMYERKNSIRTIRRNEGYTKYKLNTAKNDTYTSCKVSWTNSSGKCISGTAYVDDYKENNERNQCLRINRCVSSASEAKELAKYYLRLHNKYELTATFTFPGDPALIAGVTVKLDGFGAWNGKYIISQSKHTVSNSGYQTQIILRKVITDRYGETQKKPVATGKKTTDDIALAVIRGDYGAGNERKRRLTEAGYDYDAVQRRVNQLLGLK